ncbi:squalene/phytoene synthase family protein, partial [Sphingomonas sanguinis]
MTDASAPATLSAAIEAVMREQALAVGYAPASAREGFAALLDLDHQLASILQSTTEPMIGQMRLTWWYEALEKLDREPAPAHPVLQRLAESVLPGGVRGVDLAPMIEGWEALLDDGEALG